MSGGGRLLGIHFVRVYGIEWGVIMACCFESWSVPSAVEVNERQSVHLAGNPLTN